MPAASSYLKDNVSMKNLKETVKRKDKDVPE